MKRAAIFLDRDGTIIEDQHYPKDPTKVALTPMAIEALLLMQQKNYLLFVISNQSGVNRGLISDEEFFAVHRRVCELLRQAGVDIAEFGYCFHEPEEHCHCRKPATGLIPRRFNDHAIDFESSFVVGDRMGDLKLAQNLKAKGCLVLTGVGPSTLKELAAGDSPFLVFPGLFEFATTLP